MKIFVDGKDNVGWSIDKDRDTLINSIQRISCTQTRFSFFADIIHNIWWNHLKNYHNLIFNKKRKIIATASNFIELDNDDYFLSEKFKYISKKTDAWVAPSIKQKNILEKHGLRVFYQPFYLDTNLFKPNESVTKESLMDKLKIPKNKFEGKIIIGSFQRDSLGSDLLKPKWQKGPDLLIEILSDLPKDKFVLLLVGPRRHYVINQCKKNGIPYHYIGKESDKDDISTNSTSLSDMPELYYLTDIYVVTSISEGGPKSIMEAAMTKTFILSTDVGIATDFLNKENIFMDNNDFKSRLYNLINNFTDVRNSVEEQYVRAKKVLNYSSMDERLLNMYNYILKS